jgi:hypothetical protein
MIHLLYIIPIILIVCWFTYSYFRNRKIKNDQHKDFNNIFTSDKFPLPNLRIGTSYAWDTFEITFKIKADFENAQQLGLFTKFKDKIKSYYKADFDPELAICFTYVDKKNVDLTD